jgi:hypothetical protein
VARHRRRLLHRLFGRHIRFNLAVLFTILVVTYILVPWVVSLVDAGRGYSPTYYEPKDHTRQEYILRHGVAAVPVVTPWKLIVNLGLVFLVMLVWMTIMPPGGARRR